MTSRQETRSSRRWILVALLVFLLCLVLWIVAALILNIAFAESLPFSLGLRSRLAANYAPDEFVGSLGIFRLSIIDEVLLDRGMSPEEAEEQSEKIKNAMGSPVPTATARDFEGKLPFTATPTEPPPTTITVSPTETSMPTSTLMMAITATNTPKPATETPAVPSKTPTSGPSPTPTKCLVDPFVEIRTPSDGAVYTLADNLPAEAFAYDPDNVDPDTCQPIGVYPSDNGKGINRVEFEIWWLDGAPDVHVHSQTQLSVKYCGFTGTTSCNTFPVNSSTWPGGAPVSGGWHKLKARARDDGNHWSGWVEVEFYLDIGPTATPTYTPVNTSTYTPTPTHTSTPTPTGTYTPTPTATSTSSPTPDTCSLITISGFNFSGNNVWWTVTNGSSTAITFEGIYFIWPTANGGLNHVKWNGGTIWDMGWSIPPADIITGWTMASRVINPGQTSQLEFSFDSPAEPTVYTLTLTFDNGCTPSKTD